MIEAYWQNDQGNEAVYSIMFVPTKRGRRGWAEYQSALFTILKVSETLKPEGFKVHYRNQEAEGGRK